MFYLSRKFSFRGSNKFEYDINELSGVVGRDAVQGDGLGHNAPPSSGHLVGEDMLGVQDVATYSF